MNRKRLIPIVVLLVLGTAIGFRLKAQLAPPVLTGFVEADISVLKSEVNGRVVELPAEEGSEVSAGDLLARLDTSDILARIVEAEAQVSLFEGQVRQAVFNAQLAGTDYSQGLKAAGARHAGSRARLDLALAGARNEDIEGARAALGQAKALEENAASELARITSLFKQGIVSQSAFDNAATGAESAVQARKAAQESLTKLESGSRTQEIEIARADLAGAGAELIRTRESQPRVKAAETSVEILTAQLNAAEARLGQLRIAEAKHEIKAPFDGVIQSRIVNPGELAAAGSPLFSIYDPARIYVRVYVALDLLPRFPIGSEVEVQLDGVEQPVTGKVFFVDDSAQFTPRDVQLPEDRVRQVVAVKLRLDSPDRLHPGMTASVVIPRGK